MVHHLYRSGRKGKSRMPASGVAGRIILSTNSIGRFGEQVM
jgi:hypothetical protein